MRQPGSADSEGLLAGEGFFEDPAVAGFFGGDGGGSGEDAAAVRGGG